MNRVFAKFCVCAFAVCLCCGAAASRPALSAPLFTTLYNFAPLSNSIRPDGSYPGNSPLVQGSDGNFYGTAVTGGTSNGGTIFKITPSGVLTTVASFTNTTGSDPYGGLVLGRDGNFYGTTIEGGAAQTGTVYRLTPGGTLTTLYDFSPVNNFNQFINADGAQPAVALVQGRNGNFYGTTLRGGTSGIGTVFKITPSGDLTSLVSFTGANGASPLASLIQGCDGDFYGTTQQGGANNNGTVFRITPAGSLTTLYSFSAADSNGINADGVYPQVGLTLMRDGNFYGTTTGGGFDGIGTAFKIRPSGALTTLASFRATNGAYPETALILGRDGNLYGTAQEGGVSDDGTVFRLTPAGTLTALVSFDGTDGLLPTAGLTLGGDGSFYGTTSQGGTSSGNGESGTGTIFRVDPTAVAVASFLPASGPVGSMVTITGINLDHVTSVRFHDASAQVFSASADGTQVAVTVPLGAEKGTITVTNAAGSATTIDPFRVTYAPVITSFSPVSGPVGSTVTIMGTHLSGITRVRFHHADATVYSSNVDGTQLTVTVPPGGATGTITLDNRDALATTSAGIFTVTP